MLVVIFKNINVINSYNYKFVLIKVLKSCNILLQRQINSDSQGGISMLTQIEIGTRIKQIRESKGISQQSLVNELNEIGMSLSRETLSKIENGNRTLAVHELKGICKVLDVDVEVLLKEEEDEVTLKKLFRKQNLQEETLKKIDVIEDMIINFVSQKNLPKKEKRNVKPLWRS